MSHSIQNDPSLSHLIMMGGLRSVAIFPFEHPLELWKISTQATPEFSSLKVVINIYKEKGFLGFTNTSLSNFPKRFTKEAIRWPVIGYTHKLLVEKCPEVFSKEGTNAKVVTGISVAIFSSVFILPFERLIAHRVKQKQPYLTLFTERSTKEGIFSLYRGFRVNLFREAVIWSSLMAINNETKKKFDLIDKKKSHPYLRQGLTSLFITMGMVTWGLPIDFVKARIQMDGDLQKKKISSIVRTLFGRHGISGFYAGALPVSIHTFLHASLGGIILDKIFASNK